MFGSRRCDDAANASVSGVEDVIPCQKLEGRTLKEMERTFKLKCLRDLRYGTENNAIGRGIDIFREVLG